MKFSDFALRPEILQAVTDAGYTVPTPIQERAIPAILTGADLLGIAQTGTGKTAAFVLPMIERLAQGQAKARMPRSLILSPTRELATPRWIITKGLFPSSTVSRNSTMKGCWSRRATGPPSR
jgi:superfamily II DNA/RNA helicase